MQSASYPKKEPFDAVTGELRSDYRDAYLLGQLTPVPAQQIEAYLTKSPIQKSVLLGRYHELSASATAAGRTLVPPHWVQLQLRRQASYSAAGPWRRPVVRLAGGLLLALSLASGVQWLRNEPLVPTPVAAAVARAATSASQATQALVQRFTAPRPTTIIAEAGTPAQTRKKFKEMPRPTLRHPVAAAAVPSDSAAQVTAALADSARLAAPASSASTGPAPVPKNTPLMQAVRGHVSDVEGRPLPGATVLVPGTLLATTTNATGDYALNVPAGTSLKFGYVGCADEVLNTTSTAVSSTHNVVLTPEERTERARRRR